MIPKNLIEQWRVKAPWQTLAMIEQHLIAYMDTTYQKDSYLQK